MSHSNLKEYLDQSQSRLLAGLDSPAKIQALLDDIPYSTEDANRSPARVLRDRVAHCLDGALLGAALLCRLGYPPLVLDMWPEPGTDDDHVLAVYRRHGCWGAVAKSNFAGLRSREPVYRTLRELVLSYFEFYFNVDGLKTLRSYTRPINLAQFDRLEWLGRDEAATMIEKHLARLSRRPVLTPDQAASLCPADPLTYQAGTLGVNPAGLYKPGKGKIL